MSDFQVEELKRRLAVENGVQGEGPEYRNCQQNVGQVTYVEKVMSQALGQISIYNWWRTEEITSYDTHTQQMHSLLHRAG